MTNRSVQPFCTADGIVSSGMPWHVLSTNNCLFARGDGSHVTHAFSGPPESITQTASGLVQTYLHSSRKSVVRHAAPSPSKLLIHMGDLYPHLICGSLGPPNKAPQWHLERFSHFCKAHGIKSLYFTMSTPFSSKLPLLIRGSRPHLTHGSLGLSKPKTQMASRSV